MDFQQFLIRGFDYDRWANRRWMQSLGGFKQLERAQGILDHIHGAQNIWLERCGVVIEHLQENTSLIEIFDVMTRAWIMLIESVDSDQPITYVTMAGEQYTQSMGSIALHVINHGTYHRGQLRGLAEADGFTQFPETDLLLFLREHSS